MAVSWGYGKNAKGRGWYSFNHKDAHFVGLSNVAALEGLGKLGPEQLQWLEADLESQPASRPVVVFAHIPLWSVYPDWGWGTEDSAQALGYLKRFGSVTVLNGHIGQGNPEGRRQRHVPHRHVNGVSTATAAGNCQGSRSDESRG